MPGAGALELLAPAGQSDLSTLEAVAGQLPDIIDGATIYPVFKSDNTTFVNWAPILKQNTANDIRTYSAYVTVPPDARTSSQDELQNRGRNEIVSKLPKDYRVSVSIVPAFGAGSFNAAIIQYTHYAATVTGPFRESLRMMF